MRKFTILAAAAPLALLAACGDADTDEAAMDDTADLEANDMADGDTDGGDAEVSTPTSLDDAGDFSGTYSTTGPDGNAQSITLDSANNSYEYTDADGNVRTGNYERMGDGYRFYVADFYGAPRWFSISNGSLVSFEEDLEVTPESDYSAEDDGFQDRAVWSRSPELGSPVAPQD